MFRFECLLKIENEQFLLVAENPLDISVLSLKCGVQSKYKIANLGIISNFSNLFTFSTDGPERIQTGKIRN